MNLNLIAAAEQATPLLMESAKNGTLNEELFMDILKMQRAALSDADWVTLLVTLLAMTPNQDSQVFEPIEAARTQLQTAYQERMGEVMSGLVRVGSSAEHREWLAEAELCLEQFERVSVWLQTLPPAASSPAAAQSSAA